MLHLQESLIIVAVVDSAVDHNVIKKIAALYVYYSLPSLLHKV